MTWPRTSGSSARTIVAALHPAGAVSRVSVKNGRDGSAASTAFAFVEFDSVAAAEAAVRERSGSEFSGGRLRVEMSRGGYVSTASRGPPRRGGFRVRVFGLPPSASWQDLKDEGRKGGAEPGFSDIKGGVGILEYSSEADAERVVSGFSDIKGGTS